MAHVTRLASALNSAIRLPVASIGLDRPRHVRGDRELFLDHALARRLRGVHVQEEVGLARNLVAQVDAVPDLHAAAGSLVRIETHASAHVKPRWVDRNRGCSLPAGWGLADRAPARRSAAGIAGFDDHARTGRHRQSHLCVVRRRRHGRRACTSHVSRASLRRLSTTYSGRRRTESSRFRAPGAGAAVRSPRQSWRRRRRWRMQHDSSFRSACSVRRRVPLALVVADRAAPRPRARATAPSRAANPWRATTPPVPPASSRRLRRRREVPRRAPPGRPCRTRRTSWSRRCTARVAS